MSELRATSIRWNRRQNGEFVATPAASPANKPSSGQGEPEPRSEIDDVVDRGVQALENGQYEEAAELFRGVVQRAPFRHDARQYLAYALDRHFNRESDRMVTRHAPAPLSVTSSGAAVAAPTYKRVTHFRFPLWLIVGSIAITGLAIGLVYAVISYMRETGVRQLVENIGKPKAPPPAPVAPKASGFAEVLKQADGALTRGQFDDAIEVLKKTRESAAALTQASELKPLDDKLMEAYGAKAEALLKKENYDRALEAAQEGLKINEASAALNFLVGRAYERKATQARSNNDMAQGRVLCEKACEALEKTVKQEPDNLAALELLGKTYSRFDEIKAIETWRLLVNKAPDSKEGKAAKDYLQFRQIQ